MERKNIITIGLALLVFAGCGYRQQRAGISETGGGEDYLPKYIHLISTTPVKDQGNSELCWAYGMLATIEITIVQRSQRQSAVAAAAYQSGEKLFCEYDQQVKHYPEKRGIVHNEILLPANAPQEYADRNTLWNAAEAVEKQWNSQLARRWVLTIPREIPPDQYAVLVREFCQQQFVSKGMIVDFAIHDPHPPGHNPHAHVLLTMRAIDEHGKWLPKSRKVYDLDENGERIKLPSGRWKSHKEDIIVVKERPQQQMRNPARVKGVVKDQKGHPLPGVTVLIKGTALGVVTDADGNYSLELPGAQGRWSIHNSYLTR